MDMFLGEVKRKLIGQRVLEKIRKKIILNDIKKGEHLKETELSEQMGVSRGPIREAITQLEKEGLIHTSKNGRSKVIGFSINDVENLYFSRIIIETSAVDQMIFPLNKQWLLEIEILVKSMENKNLSTEQLNFLDLKFHYMLIYLSNNKTLIQMWLSIKDLIKTIMEITNEQTSTKRDRVINHHQAIVKALHSGDHSNVKRSLEEHLEYAREVLKSYFVLIQNEID